MKKIALAGFVSLILASCNTNTTPTPVAVYNPDANLTQSTDARTPYQGDWVMVASLADGTTKYGTVSVSTKSAATAGITNASGGALGWASSSTSTTNDEQGTALLGTVNVGGSGRLFVTMTPKNSTTARFYTEDYDGKVEVISGKATIGGKGTWTNVGTGTSQSATFVFVQTSTTASVTAQSLSLSAVSQSDSQVALAALKQLNVAGQRELAAEGARPSAASLK
ncbi:hypothetical protein [Deinococcus altitudinis]|uniref:hypothetical protein n=1 Tax=Deinococcus altitudinis TaxID=468914 RepID=UPI0038916454